MKHILVKLPTEFHLRPALLIEYDKDFKEVIVEVRGAWKLKNRINLPLEDVYLATK